METSTRHRERQRIQLKDLTKRHEIPAPAMRKYFFRSSICIMGEILGGRQLEWHPPRKWGIRACCTQASSHSNSTVVSPLNTADLQCRAPVPKLLPIISLSHQPCELSHHPCFAVGRPQCFNIWWEWDLAC